MNVLVNPPSQLPEPGSKLFHCCSTRKFSETLGFGMSSRDTKGGKDDNHFLLHRLRGPIESCQVQDWTSLINVVLAIEILELSETNVLGVCKDALDAPREDNTVNLTKS